MAGISLANVDVGGIFNGIGELAKDIREAITGEISPEAKAALLQKASDLEAASTNAQLAINLADAQSGSNFRGGWRPSVGWVGVIGMAYTFLLHPLFSWASLNFNWVAPPDIDASVVMNLLFAILGLGGMRTVEAIKGVK